jgi:16S rRNA (cytosine967-C5)-methyltransferase
MELTQGVLRHLLLLDHRIDLLLNPPSGKKLKPPVRMALRIGLYQILFLHKIPARAVVNETVGLLAGTPFDGFVPLVNAVLRRGLAEPAPEVPDLAADPAAHLSLTTSTPPWLVERLGAQWGWEETRALLMALNRPAPLTLRANTLRIGRDRLIEALAQGGMPARPGTFAPDAVVLEGGGSPAALAPFRDGLCTVQDEGAQLLAPLLAPRAGETVLDACAAPGGKAGHLAQLMGDRGRVVAADLSPARARMIGKTMARLGIHSVAVLAADLTEAPALFRAPFDRVLLDAPCTGTGVLRRHPEGKWRKDPAGIPALTALQDGLLAACASVLRPGGRLLYTTCSLLREENEEVIDRFLAGPGGGRLSLVPLSGPLFTLPEGAVTARGELRTWPHRHGTDGFFAALLERR